MNYEKVSKKLSYILRHSTDPQYVYWYGGWANVQVVLDVLKIRREDLEKIVAEDSKGRYSFDVTGMRIRANQGHSIPGVVIDME